MFRTTVALRKLGGLTLLLCLLFCLPVGSGMAFLSAFERIVGSAIPYPEAEDLFRLTQVHPDIPGGAGEFSPAQIERMRASLTAPEAVVGFRAAPASFRAEGVAEQVRMAIASPEYLTVMTGESPPERFRRERGVFVSRDLWDRRFGELAPSEAPPVFIDDRPYEVLGLLPDVPLYPVDADLLLLENPQPGQKYDATSFFVSALVKRAGPHETSWRAEVEALEAPLAELAGLSGPRSEGYAISVRGLQEDLAGDAAGLLTALQLCAFALLVLGAFNSWAVWSSFLARERSALVTRMALGAESAALRRRYLALAAVTIVIAVAAGVWLASVLLSPLRDILTPLSARHSEIELSALAVGLVGGAAVLLGVLSATLAWKSANLSPRMALRPTPSGATIGLRRWEWLILVVQGTLCCVLILIGIVASKQLQDRRGDDLGFDPSSVKIAGVSLPEPSYGVQERVLAFVNRVRDSRGLDRENLAVATSAPLAGEFIHAWMIRVEVPESDRRLDTVIPTRLVSSNYFSMIGARFLRGEEFPDRVSRDLEVVPVVANEALVDEYWPNDPQPLGRRFFARGKTFRVVGIVETIRETTLDDDQKSMLYLPYSMRPASELFFLWRERPGRADQWKRVFEVMRAVEPEAVVFEKGSLTSRYREALFLELAMASLFGVMAIFAFLMYFMGVLAHLMQRGHSEARSMAIRLALGSPPGSVFWRFVLKSFAAVSAGVLGGAFLYRLLAGLTVELEALAVPLWQVALIVLSLAGLVLAAGAICLSRLSLGDLRSYLETQH